MMERRISLEPEAVEVSDANSKPPLIFQLPPWKGRQVLEEVQSTPVCMYPADISKITVNTGKWGEIPVYIVCPEQISSPANVIFYIHGAGRIFKSSSYITPLRMPVFAVIPIVSLPKGIISTGKG
jgi:hypothetical protein